ncbi:MAG: arginine--tRNA ligase [Candidatus Nezhaarchaeales archaeon]|nr:MAG: arginine--tRNA ligase [Candidatus Nezhaarchaeota archaeon WYZ-LMO8]TDA37256.1 MAG: arginine--tRNA ligase [Candidatus Nezhaarchaeota archaeon WYZ-LMO7]
MRMSSSIPFKLFEEECLKLLKTSLEESRIESTENVLVRSLEIPPAREMGELALPCFELAKLLRRNPKELAEELAAKMSLMERKYVSDIKPAGLGYINFYVNHFELAQELFTAVTNFGSQYGLIKVERPLKIIVEHTSGNPIHPLTIGTGRNAVIGDSLASLLRSRGHDVKAHFYVNDVGLQVMIAAYGYSKVMDKIKGEKFDHSIGIIYPMTNSIVEIIELRKRLERASDDETKREILKEIDEWVGIAYELRNKDPELFDYLLSKISEDEDPKSMISKLNKDYEEGAREAVEIVRGLCKAVIEGFKQTLSRMWIKFDSWDWESEIAVWSKATEEVIGKIGDIAPWALERSEGALVLNVNGVASALNLKEKWGLADKELPKLTLRRADGTSLYTTRDIVYAFWKLKKADKVINVIGAEQSLAQLQLKIVLALLGVKDVETRYIHYAYELVKLPGAKMSSRRGRYIPLDDLLNESVNRVRIEVEKRGSALSEEEKKEIAEVIGVGAVKYALLNVTASKPITFDFDQVVNFERNSFPFINYTYVRALGILRKSSFTPTPNVDTSKLTHEYERELVIQMAKYPKIFIEAADELKPELLTNYLNQLSELFNSYYEKVNVIKEKDEETRKARLMLVYSIKTVIESCTKALNFKLAQRM